ADTALKVLWVTRTVHLDLGELPVDLAQILRRQLDVGGAEVLLQAMKLRGARDGYDPGLLRQQPRDRDLRRGRLLALRNAREQIDERLVCLQRVRREAREDLSQVVAGELRRLAELAGEKALAQGREGDEPDPQLLAGG